jgi:hypothetical protein
VAGFGAGSVATLVMHPLDLVKVRFQLADDRPPANAPGAGERYTVRSRMRSRSMGGGVCIAV